MSDEKRVYKLEKRGPAWLCQVDGCDCLGGGSSPNAAISSWRKQHRLNELIERSTTCKSANADAQKSTAPIVDTPDSPDKQS